VGFLSELLESYKHGLERHRNRPFMEAAMAASALVSMADGAVSLGDRTRLDRVLATLEALQVYDPHECVNQFNRFAEAVRSNPKQGHDQAMQAVLAESRQHPNSGQMLIRVCLALSEIGGKIPLVEQIEIVSLCTQLGIDPESVGLYRDPTMPDEDPRC